MSALRSTLSHATAILTRTAIVSIFAATLAHAEGINLGWDDCGTFGAALKTFACNSNSGAGFTAVASFVPPAGITDYIGTSAEIDITSSSSDLPDWWKHGTGFCRGTTALGMNFDFTGGPFNCVDFNAGQAAGGFAYDVAFGAPNRARLRVQYAVPFDNGGPLNPTQEYYGFKVFFLRTKTTGTGSCSGCDVPVTLQLANLQLFQDQSLGYDPVLTTPLIRSTIKWQTSVVDQPQITGISPSGGVPGITVTIAGSKFTGTNSVQFGSQAAAFSVVTDAQIQATTPPDARTARIVVTTPNGTASSDSFVVRPVIAAFTPTQAPVNSIITISGYNFTRSTAAAFNGHSANLTVVSDGTARAVVPADASDGPISIANPGGTGVSAASFHLGEILLPPTVQSIAPAAGAPGTLVTITGTQFTSANLVAFGGVATTTFQIVSDASVVATVPAGALTGAILVQNAGGSASSSATFIVAPVVTGFQPTSGPVGTQVKILGHNLTYATAVLFNGIATTSWYPAGNLTASVPAGASDGPITVVNPGGQSTSAGSFVVTAGGVTSTINLAWDDCGSAGSGMKTFTCDSDAGAPFTIVASFVPPLGVSQFLGASAQFDITTDGGALPDWWKHGAALCRGTTGLSVSFDFASAGPFTCAEFNSGQAAGGYAYDVGYVTPDRARLRVQYAVPYDQGGPLSNGVEYYAFKTNLLRARTSACTGCTVPTCIVLNSIQLFQDPTLNFDPEISHPQISNFVFWQGTPNNCPASTPVLATLVTADAEPGRVHLVWSVGEAERAVVYRSTTGVWRRVAELAADGSRRVTYDDTDVKAGASYGYRIGISAYGYERFVGETTVAVPAAAELALSAPHWDATAGGLAVSFSLPTSAPAKLEVFDLVGRRSATQRLEGAGAGPQHFTLATRGGITSGVYFARLTQGKASVTRRFVIYR